MFWGRSRKRSGFPLQVLAEAVGFPLQSLTCKCTFIYITFFFFIYSLPPVSGIGLSLLPVPLQALRQATCQKVNAKPGRTNGTHSSVLPPGASPAVETFRAPSRPNKFPWCLSRQPLIVLPVFPTVIFLFGGFAMTNRIILCLRNFPPVSATTSARPSAKTG